METKNNIAAILKDKPQGTKLYDWLHNIDVELDTISTTDTETVVWCTNETNNNTTCHRGYSEFGTERGYPDGLQILFPSKEMRDWAKFSWKKGDVLVSNDGGTEVIFDKWYDDTYTNFYGRHYLNSEDKNNVKYNETFLCTTERYAFEDKNAAKTYLKTIEERLGGKLNLENLEIEKQLEFKDGDIVVAEGENKGKKIFIFRYKIRDSNTDEHGYKSYINVNSDGSLFNNMTFYLRKDFVYRPATDSEKQQLFEALAKENKVWDAEKKQIVDLKPKVELKPFDKVLVRDSQSDKWRVNLFGYIDKDEYYHCVFANWVYCIPYKGNEHMLGTTKDVEG